MSADILIVDDEVDIRELVAGILQDEGFSTRVAGSTDEALTAIEARRPHMIFLDIWLQGSQIDGLQFLELIMKHYPDLPVVMISGHGNIETAVAAIKLGAYDFIEKPFKADRLILVAERALETMRLKREIKDLKTRTHQDTRIIGQSVSINHLRTMIERMAPTNARVLITGDAGSGKELVARTIHSLSSRNLGPFVHANLGTIALEKLEEELFGIEEKEGIARKIGILEEAHGGTLYLDEISDLSKDMQNRFLRVLVENSFQRVGGNTRVHVDVRIISSSSKDLVAEIEKGNFREDLFHRLSVMPIRVPSLSERREDVPELIAFFMEQISLSTGLPKRRISIDALAVLQAHDWPGNIRQLRNNIERLMILVDGDSDSEVTADLLPKEIGALVPTVPNGGGEKLMNVPLREAREIFEKEYLLAQIARFGGNISRTAEFVGMERSALHRKLKTLGIGTNHDILSQKE